VTAPFTFGATTGSSGASSVALAVTSATSANDALTVAFAAGGSSLPVISSIGDGTSNVYVLAQSWTSSSPYLFVWTVTGATSPLATTATVTINFSSNPNGATACIGTDCPGVNTLDVSVIANGSSATPSVAGTPGASGESAVANYAWANGGGAGSVTTPFSQLTQEHATSGTYLTNAYDLNPTSGSSLTAAASITSASWRVVLLTFKEVATAAPVADPPYVYMQATKRASLW
jgi:hypothetical protein